MANHENKGGALRGSRFLTGKLGSTRRGLTGNIVLLDGDPFVHFLDPAGANRTITLPTLTQGDDWRVITHVGSANSLQILSAAGTVCSLAVGESALCFGSAAEWVALRGWATLGVFGPAGPGHNVGLVPDPGAVAGLHRFLQDDGTWTSVTTAGIVDAYKQISDGTNTAVSSGLSQFRLRSADSSVVVTVTDNDATFGDVASFVVDPTHVNHNLLLNYVANQHIDHTSVSIATSEGIQGGGTIAATRNLKLDFSALGTATPALTDTVAYFQTATHFKTTWNVINGILVHNSLSGYVANEHINHTSVSVIAGVGLSGGGDISANRTINVSYGSLATTTSMSAADLLAISHGAVITGITFSNFNAALDHNILINYVSNQHVDHSAVSIVAGTGLSGGGTITTSRTLNLTAAAAGAIGGVFSSSAGANQFATGISITGTIQYAQPAFSNLSGSVAASQMPALTGVVTTVAGAVATSFTNNGVTNAVLADMSALSLKANLTGGSADPTDSTLTAVLDALLGSTRGQLLVRGAATWSALTLGSNTQVLTSNGADALWAAAAGSSGTETFALHSGLGGL